MMPVMKNRPPLILKDAQWNAGCMWN